MISGPLAALLSGFAGSVLCAIACAVVAGALDAKRRDVGAAGAVMAVAGLVGAGAGLVAPWAPAARVVLFVAIAGAVASTIAASALGRGATGPRHLRVLLVGSLAFEVLLGLGAWMAFAAHR